MIKKLIGFIVSVLIAQTAYAGTVSFDQLATSSDLTVAKYNSDLNTIFTDYNSNVQSTNIADDTVAEVDMADNANPRIRTYEGASCEKVYSGLLPSTTSGTLVGSIPSGTAYPLGYRVVKSSSTPKTFTANKWTYVDLDINGDFTYSEVTIDSSAPAVAVNSMRLARVSTDSTQVFEVTDLRVTNCAAGPFEDISDVNGEATLDDLFANGASVRRFSEAGRTPNGLAQGAFVSWDSATTFKVTAGSLYINGRYRSNSSDITVPTTLDTPLSGVSGLDTGSVTGGPKRYCVYGVADQESVPTYSATFSENCTSPTGVTYARLLGSITTDASNNFSSRDVVTAHAISEREIAGGWIKFAGTGTVAIYSSYNVSSITDNGTGDYTVTWDKDFASDDYAVVCTPENGQCNVSATGGAQTGSIRIRTANTDGTANADLDRISLIAFGDTRS